MVRRVRDHFTKIWKTYTWPMVGDRAARTVLLPLGYCAAKFPEAIPPLSFSYDKNKPLPVTLRSEQESFLERFVTSVKSKNAMGWELEPGFGKTVLVLTLAARCGLVTIIAVHRKCLKEQWENEIARFGLPSIRVIMAAELKNPVPVELLVLDEAHLLITQGVIPNLSKWKPSFLLGLSGTFYRYGGDPSLDWFFPERMKLEKEEVAMNSLRKTGKVYVELFKTGIVPTYKTTPTGKLDWNSVLQSLSENEARNNIIADKAVESSSAYVLVLVKFIKHGEVLYNLISSKTARKCCLCTGGSNIDESADIYISTFKKMGTGVSIEKLNTLIVAADVENYAIQYFGRVMRNGGKDAYIIDLVDEFPSLAKHSATRLLVYKDLSASIKHSLQHSL